MANKNEINAILERFANNCQDDSSKKDLDALKKHINKYEKDSLISFIISICALAIAGAIIFYFQSKTDDLFELENNKIDEQFDSIRNVIIGINNDLGNELKEKNTISYNVRNDGTIITYKDLDETNDRLKKEKDSISTKLHELESKYNSSKSELNHIKEVYPIKYIRKNYKKNGKEYIQTEVYSPQIDSALMLLDSYRDKLYYNKERNTWIIK